MEKEIESLVKNISISKRTYLTRYPKVKSDLLITLVYPVGLVYFKDVVSKYSSIDDLSVKTLVINTKERYTRKNWIPKISYSNIYIGESFINHHVIKNSESFESFNSFFPDMIKSVNDKTQELKEIIDKNPDNPNNIFMSVFFKTHDNFIFQFLYRIENHIIDTDSFNKLLDIIIQYEKIRKPDFIKKVQHTLKQRNRTVYFEFSNGQWIIVDPMVRLCREINNEYLKGKDIRIRKPLVFVHKEYFGKRFEFDTNWVLSSDTLETMMIRPNEVSLFNHISDMFLEKGKTFFKETLLFRLQHQSGRFPTIEDQKEYYDFFETMMVSLIFSYTSIETLVNICIPFYFKKRIRENGKYRWIFKQDVEREFELTRKMNPILKDILRTPDPSSQSWWKPFLELKGIRDEIIHSKQSKSEELYSQFLTERIIPIIEVKNEIIKFYGKYINLNKRELLEDFPYDFGFDEFIPIFRNERYFKKLWDKLHNPRPRQ